METCMQNSVRILLINSKNQIALISADDPKLRSADGSYCGRFWFLPGGKIEGNESTHTAIYRELAEETGLPQQELEIGTQVWQGTVNLLKDGAPLSIRQTFWVVYTKSDDLNFSQLDNWEKDHLKNIRWFSMEDVKTSKEIIYPIGLSELLADILNKKFPAKPLEIDLNRKA